MTLENMIVECVEDSTRWFPGKAQSLPNLTLCLAGEVGEVANLVKKIVRNSITLEEAISGVGLKDPLQYEIIDCLIYLCNLMGNEAFKDVDWETIWKSKRAYNEARFGGELAP